MDDIDIECQRRQRGEVQRPSWCICDDAYWHRCLDDPSCRHDEMEELWAAVYDATSWIVAGEPQKALAVLTETRARLSAS